jgi:4-hydroxy-tetrahydrodipicolinate synthase
MMELVGVGIRGVMPGLGMADMLQQVWRLGTQGQEAGAWALYEKLLPHIVFSLQNFELFAWLEKDLLARRGVIPVESTYVRCATYRPDEHTWRHGQKLNARIAELGRHRGQG